MLIDIIAGNYSDFLKIAPIINVVKQEQRSDNNIGYRLIYTGSQTEINNWGDYLPELNIPTPSVFLECTSKSENEQTASILVRYGKVLYNNPPDVCIVTGTTNAAMSCSIAASRAQGVLIAHMEAGIRGGDRSSKNEVHSLVTDVISDYYFTTSRVANENLRLTGIPEEHIFFVGNTLIDTLNKQANFFNQPKEWATLNLQPEQYCLLSIQSSLYSKSAEDLKSLLLNIIRTSKNIPIVFLANSDIIKTYQSIGIRAHNLYVISELDYWQKGFLTHRAKVVITDDPILQVNTTGLRIPCITVAEQVAHPETVEAGSNIVIENRHDNFNSAFEKLYNNHWKKSQIPYLWDGKSGERIIKVLKKIID
ncbi:MAG: UDP-N-acetylglucosamine 2-epimerase [Flavipsychrobacter sp.]